MHMTQTITLTKTEYSQLLQRVSELEKTLTKLAASFGELLRSEPPYGSDAWWQWSNRKSKEDFAKGDFYTITNKKDLNTFLTNARNGRSNEQFHHRVRS